MNKRSLLVAGVGAACALAGGGIAWWRMQEAAAAQALWRLEMETPDGGLLRMETFRHRPLLLNFWATWCPPCVEEMPLLDGFYQKKLPNRFQIVGIAVDQREPVQRFLARTPVGYPIVLAGLAGSALSRSLGNSSGGLPFSAFFDAGGALRTRKMGRLGPQDIATWESGSS